MERGFATQAVKGMSEWAALNPKNKKLIGVVACENIGSARVLEKAGFHLAIETEMLYLGKLRKCREYSFPKFQIKQCTLEDAEA